MKTKITVLIFSLVLMFSMGIVLAEETDEPDEMEATMRLMGNAEAELPDAVIKVIELPKHLRDEDSSKYNPTAVEASAKGLLTANENRSKHDDEPQQANDARDNAADMAGDAHDNRETRGRSGERPDPPGRPDNPGPPGQN
jgi:hypothetical protein